MLSFRQLCAELRDAAPHMTEYELHFLATAAMFYAQVARRPGWRWKQEGKRHGDPASSSRQRRKPGHHAV